MPVAALILAAALLSASPQVPAPAQAPAASSGLAEILAKAAGYCRKLEGSAFDFVCREEIRETIDPKLDAAALDSAKGPGSVSDTGPGASNFFGPTIVLSSVKKIKRSFVYDYQCIRAGRAIRESRTMLEENGKKKVRENANLQTSIVVFATALLGPVGLFGERFQADYDYRILRAETAGPLRLLIVDATPKPGARPSRNLYGRAWIDPATGDIHRIEWSESRVGNLSPFEKRGEKFKRTPRLTIKSEFSAEKNGLRFPSRLEVEEAYLDDKGKAFVRSRTEVVYRDFKFFTVDYEVRD